MNCAHQQTVVQSPWRLRKRDFAGPGDVALCSVAFFLIDLKRRAVKCQLSLKGVESTVGGREAALASAVTRRMAPLTGGQIQTQDARFKF